MKQKATLIGRLFVGFGGYNRLMDDNSDKKAKLAKALAVAKGLYQLGAYVGPRVAQMALFDHRGSSWASYRASFDGHLFKNRNDFPALKDRETLTFVSGVNTLKAYLYFPKHPRALVVAAHGFTSLADGNDALYQDYLLRAGYAVLAVDLTASGASQGSSIGGMYQSAYDLKACLDMVHANRKLKHLPLLLIGHSWGAYGVTAVLNFDTSPKAVVAMSGYSSPDRLMVSQARGKAGLLADLSKPDLDDALKERSGEKGFLSAASGINHAKKTSVLLIQGGLDETVPVKNCSLYGDPEVKNPRVERLYYPEKHHDDIWFDPASCAYIASFHKAEDDLKAKYKSLSKVPPEVLAACYSLMDKEQSSKIDQAMFQRIDAFFQAAL